MNRIEQVFLAFCLACWTVSLLALGGVVDLSGRLALGLYQLFSIAAALGWIAGNVWMHRLYSLSLPAAWRLWGVYFLGAPGLLLLLRLMAPTASQQAAPLVPLFSFFVFGSLFLVPVFLRRRQPEPRRLDLRRGRDDESHQDPGRRTDRLH